MFPGTKSHRCTNFIPKSLPFGAANSTDGLADGHRTRGRIRLEVKTPIRVNSSSRSAPWSRMGESMVESMESMGKKSKKRAKIFSSKWSFCGQNEDSPWEVSREFQIPLKIFTIPKKERI